MRALIIRLITALEKGITSEFKSFLTGILGSLGHDIDSIEYYIKVLMNPRELQKALSKAKPMTISKLEDYLNKHESLPESQPKGQSTEHTQGKELQSDNQAPNTSGEWTNLQSTWLQKGRFGNIDPTTLLGDLELIMQADTPGAKVYGPYTYPMFPYEVWEKMAKASAHAGTIFWQDWLYGYYPSALRKTVKKYIGDEKGVYAGKKSKTITQAEKYARTNKAKDLYKYIDNLPKTEVFTKQKAYKKGNLVATGSKKYQEAWKNRLENMSPAKYQKIVKSGKYSKI